MRESDMQAVIVEALAWPSRGRPWLLHHDTDARRSHSGGWPDLFAVHPPTGRCLVWELKSESGRMRDGQTAWLLALMGLLDAGASIGVVRPHDLDECLRWIGSPSAPRPRLWLPDLDTERT